MDRSIEKFLVASAESTPSTTLSRNALYTPLVAYEQTLVAPTAYMANQKTIPTSLKESTLTSFLQSIGEDYHRNRATGSDPKNNGSRPLSVSDMDDRLRQRVVTLVGGGVNSSQVSSSRPPSCAKAKGRKRPRREWSQVEKILASSETNKDSLTFLRELNARWNKYMLQLLGLDSKTVQHIQASIIKSRLAVARKSIELAGAHVQVDGSTQKRDLAGEFGVLIGETRNTWSVAIRSRTRRKRRGKLAKTGRNRDLLGEPKSTDNTVRTDLKVNVAVVPKRGSSLFIILPLPPQAKEGQGGGKEDANGEEPIIEHACKSVFISLSPDQAEDISA